MNPKLSRRFILSNGLLLGCMILLTAIGVSAGADFTGPIAVFGTLACGLSAFGLMWSAHKYRTTRLSEIGVEQATMQGRLFVRWTEMSQVRMYGKAYLLEGGQGTVVVYPKAYENPEAVAEYVVARLRRVLQERGAQVQEGDTKFH